MDKTSLRRMVRERRHGLDPEIAKRAGESLADPLFLFRTPFSRSRVIAGYLSLPGELPPEPLMALCHASGRTIAVPAWDPVRHDYFFAEWTPDAPTIAGPLRVRQPRDPNPIPFESIDTVLVPGLAFDRIGGRVGFGCGWYDRLLSRCPSLTLFCGITFDWQIVSEVPAEPHDIRMDALLLPGCVLLSCSHRFATLLSNRTPSQP